ncbi:hypothetical protein [Lutibacter citreus]|uniref:hypothetical protein n=1 Tax=Lutibacter citreus TaxID=2138210 RepID=UPI000DBE0267|nr:hypothetical protein [Lutibacter citreus]
MKLTVIKKNYHPSSLILVYSFLFLTTFSAFSQVGIGETSPTAVLHLKAGTTTTGTAPLKFTTQVSPLTTIEEGTMEYVGHSLQFSQFLKRRGIAMSEDVRIETTDLINTTSETSPPLAIVQHGPNYLEVGKSEETVIRGIIEQKSNNGNLTFRVKYAGTTIHTLETEDLKGISSNTPFVLTIIATCRSIGTNGSIQINSFLEVAGEKPVGGSTLVNPINTKLEEDTTITAKWSVANTSNSLTVEQSRTLCIEPNK